MEALGRLFDVVPGVAPKDLEASASTGNRVHLRHGTGVTIVVFKGALSAAGVNPTYTLREHTAASGGTSQDLAIVDHYYHKRAVDLGGSETWTEATQAAAATVSGSGADQEVLVLEVDGVRLSDGYGWVSLDVTDPGSTGTPVPTQYGAVLYLLRDLVVQRDAPDLLDPQA